MSPQNAQLMFTQPRNHYNKTRPAYKKTAPTVTEQFTPSQLVSRNKEMTKTNKKHTLDQNRLEFRSPSNDITRRHDTRYRTQSTSRNTC